MLLHYGTWKATTLKKAVSQLNHHLEDWVDSSYCETTNVALGAMDGYNYRFDLYPGYKQIPGRVKGRDERPDWWLDFKQELGGRDYTSVVNDIEADDLLGHWATASKDFVIITVDKDLDQIAGLHYNPRKKEGYLIEQDQADQFFLRQMLMGDSIDRIPGLPGMGPKKAELIVSTGGSNKDLANIVLDQYFMQYGDTWQDWFLSNGKMLWIQRYPNDWFTLARFKNYYGCN